MRRGGGRGGVASWSAVKTLMVVNGIVWLFCGVFENRELWEHCALYASAVREFELWRLFTYMFTHLEFSHILCNMWSLWLFGSMVEGVLGKRRFIMLYVFSGLLGGIFWLLANWSNPFSWCIGASGSTSGIMLAAALAFPDRQMLLLFPPLPVKLRTLAIVFFVMEVVTCRVGGDGIAHLAHLGGMLGGFIFVSRLGGGFGFKRRLGRWFDRVFGSSPFGNARKKNGQGAPFASRLGNLDSYEVDRILDKLSTTGRSSLTEEESAILEEASRRLRDSGGGDREWGASHSADDCKKNWQDAPNANRLGNTGFNEVDRIFDKLCSSGYSSLTEEEREILDEVRQRLGKLDSGEVDRILKKLSDTGYSSLTRKERAILEDASRRLRDN